MPAKLIIIRGPSGAGKSTVAKRLHGETKRKVALIEQDFYKEQLLNHGEGVKTSSKDMRLEMFEADIKIALSHGFDVLVEGILSPDKYLSVFERIWHEHRGESYMFFMDVSLDETVRRHATRDKVAQFSANEMKDWYGFAQRSGLDWEVIIGEDYSVDDSVKLIKQETDI